MPTYHIKQMRAANFQQIHHFLKVLPFKYTEIKLTIGVKWVKTLVSSLQLTRKPIFVVWRHTVLFAAEQSVTYPSKQISAQRPQ